MWDTNDQSVLIGGLKSYECGDIPLLHGHHLHPHGPHPVQAHMHSQNNSLMSLSHPPPPPILHSLPPPPPPPPHHQNMPTYVQLLPNPKPNLSTYNHSNIPPSLPPKSPELESLNQNSNDVPSEKKFACRYCPQMFSRAPYLKRHERLHTGTFSHTCEICHKGFRDRGYYKRHMLSHCSVNKYSCDKCNTTFKSYNGFKKHTSKSGEECPKRRVQSKDASNIREVKEKVFECGFEQCDKKYKTQAELLAHNRWHTGEKSFNCHLCPESFFTNRILKVHIHNKHAVDGTYIDEKGQTVTLQTFKCNSCDKTFKFSGDLKKHTFIHTSIKNHVCKYCGKGFNKSNTLKWHINSHTGLKPYKCTVCLTAFSAKANLNSHLKTHLPDRPRLFQCPDCDKSFVSNRSLRIHQVGHSNQKPFNCDRCSRGFNQRSHFQDHMKMHENNLSFSCKLCSKKYNVKSRLKKHILYNHPHYSSDEDISSKLQTDSANDGSDVDAQDDPYCISESSNTRSSNLESNPKAVPVVSRNESHPLSLTELSPFQIHPSNLTVPRDNISDPIPLIQAPFIEPPNPSIPIPVPLSQQSCSFTEEPASNRTYTSVGQPIKPFVLPNIVKQQPATVPNQNFGQNNYTPFKPNLNPPLNVPEIAIPVQKSQSSTLNPSLYPASTKNQNQNDNSNSNLQIENSSHLVKEVPCKTEIDVTAKGIIVPSPKIVPDKNEVSKGITVPIPKNLPAKTEIPKGIIVPIPKILPEDVLPQAGPSAPLFVVKMRSYTDRPPEVIKSLEEIGKVKATMDFDIFGYGQTDSEDGAISDNPIFKDSQRKPKEGGGKHSSKYNMKRFYCKTCNKAFSRTSSLKRHVRTHSGEQPFVCGICQKGFKDKSHYKTHQFTHSENKQFMCEKCDQKFKSYGGYRSHINKNSCSKGNRKKARPKKAIPKKRNYVRRRKKTKDTSSDSESSDPELFDSGENNNFNDSDNCEPNTNPENIPENSNNLQTNVPKRTLRTRKPNNIVYISDSASSDD